MLGARTQPEEQSLSLSQGSLGLWSLVGRGKAELSIC